jgi:6-phosphogluconolactonase (cycloisomerase 2 family)
VITAASGTVSGTETLTVDPAALVSLTVKAVKVQLGAGAQMTALGNYTDQSTQDLSSSAAWTSTNDYVASVGASGGVSSLAAGQTVVTAAQGGFSGTGTLTVVASPRYLYVTSLGGRTLTRMAVDGGSGQPRFEGYQETTITYGVGFPCLTVDPSGTHAYMSTQVGAPSGLTGVVAIYTIEPATGTLTSIAGSPFAMTFPAGCVRFSPSGKFAYSTSGAEGAGDQLATFAVNPDGSLTQNDTISYPYFPTGVAVDPLGRYLYVNAVHVQGGTNAESPLYGYSINPTTGALTPLQGSPWPLANGTYGELSFAPSGNNLYVSDLNATSITQYAIDQGTGTPTSTASVDSTCINPSALQFLPDGSHAYALCGESGSRSVVDAPVVEFTVAGNGGLAAHSTAFAGAVARQMQVDEAGKFLYVLGSGSDSASTGPGTSTVAMNMVLAYQVQPDGSLKLTQQVAGHVLADSMVLLSGPSPVTWTTTHAYATSADNTVIPYTVAADGTLTAGTGVAAATGPFSASMLPWGSDLLVASQTAAPNLLSYSPSADTLLPGMSFGDTAKSGGVVISPTGTWSYVSDPAGGLVYEFYGWGPGYWTDTYIPGGGYFTYAAGTGAGPITMDPSGRYIAVANVTAKSISLIEPLGAAPTPDTQLSYTPLNLAFDGSGNLLFVAGDDAHLHMLSSNGLGVLTDVADLTLLGANTQSIAVDPFTRFVYTAGPAGLNAFTVDAAAKTLKPISLGGSATLANATGVFLDPAGQFLYVPVSSGSTHSLYEFTVNSDGSLTAIGSTPMATPDAINSMVFSSTIR